MSIWVSHEIVGHDVYPDGHEIRGGQVRSYCEGWSNHYPTTDVEGEASIDLASIPVWCVPGHHDEFSDDRGPWLRLGIHTEPGTWETERSSGPLSDRVVVMDEDAVRCLVDDLTAWLNTPKAHPVKENA